MVVATLRLQLRNLWATVLLWAQVVLDVAVVDSEVASMAVVAASEADVVGLAVAAASIVAVEVGVSVIVATALLMELLPDLGEVGLAAATEDEDSTTAALAATLILSLCLLEAAIVAAIVELTVEAATGTATATAIALAAVVGMLDKNDLTTAVGMMSRGRDAAISGSLLST